jgi:ubiquinone/menaquinone biosynthesis C-methylase UbiE
VGARAAEIEAAIAACAPHPRLEQMRTLLLGREAQIDALAAQVVLTAAEHNAFGATPSEGIARIAGFFDRAVASSPEASVALYSLGDPAILRAATAEIVEWLETEDLLRPEADVLDLGCGFGRVAEALAPRCRAVLGLDVSGGMIAEARRRFGALANVRFEQTGGENLGLLMDAAFDLVLAIDSFPYLVQAGETVVAQHLADVRRVLRAQGALVILNLSYEGDAYDSARAAEWAARFGFRVATADPNPFRLWDGSAYVLTR